MEDFHVLCLDYIHCTFLYIDELFSYFYFMSLLLKKWCLYMLITSEMTANVNVISCVKSVFFFWSRTSSFHRWLLCSFCTIVNKDYSHCRLVDFKQSHKMGGGPSWSALNLAQTQVMFHAQLYINQLHFKGHPEVYFVIMLFITANWNIFKLTFVVKLKSIIKQ